MKKNDFSTVTQDFQNFLSASMDVVPPALEERVILGVRSDLNPSSLKVLRKTFLIYFVAGSVTLSICPQFGFSLTSGHGLMHYFMQFGPVGCMLACGSFFAGISFLAVSAFLKPQEIRVLRKNKVLSHLALGGLALGTFICLGAEIVVGLGAAWLAGAVSGSFASLELGWIWRRKLVEWRRI